MKKSKFLSAYPNLDGDNHACWKVYFKTFLNSLDDDKMTSLAKKSIKFFKPRNGEDKNKLP